MRTDRAKSWSSKPRQAGKTVLLKKLLESIEDDILFVNGDDVVEGKVRVSPKLFTLLY